MEPFSGTGGGPTEKYRTGKTKAGLIWATVRNATICKLL